MPAVNAEHSVVGVTGANGFVGRAVCRRLLADGMRVVGFVRRESAIDELPGGVVPVVVADPVSKAAWADAFEGVTGIVHLIARTHVVNDGPAALPEYRTTNVDITRAVVSAAIACDVGRLVDVSSIKAVGEGGPHEYDERTPCRPRDAYGVTKREAELLVQGRCWGTGTRATIVRPPLVYGHGARGNFATLLKAVRRGWPIPLGNRSGRRSFVAVDNLADAIAACLVHPAAAGETYHVADGPAITTRELVERIATGLGTGPRIVPVPSTLLRGIGRLTGQRDRVERLLGSLEVSTRKIRGQLGWTPPIDMAEAIRRTLSPENSLDRVTQLSSAA